MAKAIAGFYRTRSEGEAAQEALLSNGFTRDEVSFLAGDTEPHETPAIGPQESVGADAEAGRDAWIGGAVGLAAGAVAAVFPLGALVMAGPLATAIGGLSLGTAAGGIIGLLKDHGVAEKDAEFYAEGVKKGGALVTVQGVSKAREKKAREILDRYKPVDTEDLTPETDEE
jgi:hypothetical protein